MPKLKFEKTCKDPVNDEGKVINRKCIYHS